MLDPVSLGIALTVIAFIIAVVFYLSGRGDDFDKMYEEKARKLLSQDKEKVKPKAKLGKKKEKKSEKSDENKKNEILAENEETENLNSRNENNEVVITKEVVTVDQNEQELKKKKKKAKKLGNIEDKQNPAIVEKKLKKKAINLSSLDTNKVLTRFASVDDVEPEYISFLATYFVDTSDKINWLEKQIEDHAGSLEYERQAKLVTDAKLKEQQNLLREYSMKSQVVDTLSKEKQMIHIECEKLRCSLQAMTKNVHQNQSLKEELNNARIKNTELDAVLSTKQAELANSLSSEGKLRAENHQIRVSLDMLKQDFASLEQAAKALTVEKELKQQSSAAEKNNQLIFEKERQEWIKKNEQLISEYQSLQSVVAELNQEIVHFEEQKTMLELKDASLAKMEENMTKQKLKFEKDTKELSDKNLRLVAEIEAHKLLVANLKNDHEQQIKKMNDSSANKENEDMIPLKSTTMVFASKEEMVSSGEIESLRLKNQELRERNFTVLEKFRELEQQLAQSRGPIVTKIKTKDSNENLRFEMLTNTISSSLGLERLSAKDSELFSSWLSSLKIALDNLKLGNSGPHEQDDILKYENALISLSNQLMHISILAEGQRNEYETRIFQLESKLQDMQTNSLKTCLSDNIAPISAKSDESDWEVIS